MPDLNDISAASAAMDERVSRLEAENILLRTVVAHLAAFADPQAKVAVVRKLTGAPSAISPHLPRTEAHEWVLAHSARDLLRMIAASATASV